MRSLKIVVLVGAVWMLEAPGLSRGAAAEPLQKAKVVAIRVIKKGFYWFRILDTGALVVLSYQEAQSLGLSNSKTAGHIVTVLAYDTWKDVEDISSAARYVAVDMVYAGSAQAYEYTRDTIIPDAKDQASAVYSYTKDHVVPEVSDYVTSKSGALMGWSSKHWDQLRLALP